MAREHYNVCRKVLHDPAHAESRLDDSLKALAGLNSYAKVLQAINGLDTKTRSSCPELGLAIADRAYDAEIDGRILVKHALDSLNDLRDSGELYGLLDQVREDFSKNDDQYFMDILDREGKKAREKLGDGSVDIFREAVNSVKKLELKFSSKDDRIVVSRRNASGEADKVEIATTRQAGQMGRVSSGEFFGGRDGKAFISPNRIFVPIDCHHRPARVGETHRLPLDIYAGAVGGLAMTKSLLYQHARRVSELGPRGLRGEDPVTAILVTIAVIGAALVIYGIATGNGYVTVFGAILIVGAALVAFGGFALVLAVVA
jgi:hypothetical protein